METELLRTLATNFASQSVRSAKAIREIHRLDPAGFPAAVLEVLGTEPELPGGQFLVAVLASKPDWLRTICNPEKYTLDQSLELVLRAHKLDPLTAVKLADLLDRAGSATDAEARFMSRVFAVLKQIPSSTALPALRQLAKCPNPHVRSKAVLLIGQIYQNPQFVQRADLERDARVSANAVESVWGQDSAAARESLLKAAMNAHHRIAANGMVGLYMIGDERSLPLLFRLSDSEMPLARSAAAWAMGHLGDPRFLPRLARLAEDPDQVTRRRSSKSMARIRQKVTQKRAAGTMHIEIRSCEGQEGGLRIGFDVTKEGEPVNGLDARQFVVWSGGDVVEEFSCSRGDGPAEYRITFEGPQSSPAPVMVQVYTAEGVGEDPASD
jgi:HEAT repeat protein